MEREAIPFDVYACFRIDGESNVQSLDEDWLHLADRFETSSKLGMDGWPAYRCRFDKGMQAIGKPHVYIDRHRTWANCFDCLLAHRHGVALQRLPEAAV